MRAVPLPGRSLSVVPMMVGLMGMAVAAQGPLPPLPPDAPPMADPRPHDHDHAKDGVLSRLNPFRPVDPSAPLSVPELCKKLDCLAEELRDDGLILVKQPDVFSQARLTRFRNDFDNQMSNDLGNFHLVLAARISRLDAATTTQTTALGAALSAPGTSNVQVPDATKFIGAVSGSNSPFASTTSLFPTNAAIDPKNGAFGGLGVGPSTMALASGGAGGTLALGVDPTVYLDEKKRFLDHLNQIRRINQGPDQNDSSGYGLYVVRMPVSIQPGECTNHGHGADLALNVEHEFAPDFLPSAFRNLVINDLVDQVGPFLYEVIRTDTDEELIARHEARERRPLIERQSRAFVANLAGSLEGAALEDAPRGRPPLGVPPRPAPVRDRQRRLAEFVVRQEFPPTGDRKGDRLTSAIIADRLDALANYAMATREESRARALHGFAEQVRNGEGSSDLLTARVADRAPDLAADLSYAARGGSQVDDVVELIGRLYLSTLPDDVGQLDDLLAIPRPLRESVTQRIAANTRLLTRDPDRGKENNVSLSSSRSPKQVYPIAPRELLDFLLLDNVALMARDVGEASRSKTPPLNDIRAYLRQVLSAAYEVMARPAGLDAGPPPPLADPAFMDRLCEAIRQRKFIEQSDQDPFSNRKGELELLYDELIGRLGQGRDNLKGTPIGAFCWAIALDAAVLDVALRMDADKVFATKGMPPGAQLVRFYLPRSCPNPEGTEVFHQYVKQRWPIVTFSLDPVTDQQNIADTFNLKRDLQLAVSFAFATGQINFNQLNTFRRQIEQSSDTIALNRTVTASSYGNDNFGFRFTPRFQNPPNQRTNFGVIASQLISGGPGPDYQVRKSKLEPGLRELNAVLLVPDFLPTVRLNAEGNWFKLNDPEHLVFHTGRALERGRKVQELRKAVLDACGAQTYRGDDLRVLQRKLAQLEAMLPMQSTVVRLPYDNMANGFDLLSDGVTALAPELIGYSGVDVITPPSAAVAATPNPAGTMFPAPGSNGLQLLTTTSPNGTTQTVSVAGGTTSIADLFVHGKFLNLLDSNVVVGGRSAAFQLLSREVMHVQVPANVTPMTTDDGKTYLEVYASTPNGISNTLLVPYAAATPAPATAYDLDPGGAAQTVYYQPTRAADGTTNYVPSFDLGQAGAIAIKWDDATGVAPRRLLIFFDGTVNGQGFRFALPADPSATDDYTIPPLKFAAALLKAIQPIAAVTNAVPPTVTLTLSVQPYQTGDDDSTRVRSRPKALKTPMAVTFQFYAVDAKDLPAAPEPDEEVRLAPRRGDRALAGTPAPGGAKQDPGLARTARQVVPAIPPSPSLSLPQPPAATPTPPLLAPNVANEAEQVARMLTGQPLPPPPPAGPVNTAVAATTTPATATRAGSPPIVVAPAPVVVIPGKDVDKHADGHRARRPSLLKKLGNRISNALPGARN